MYETSLDSTVGEVVASDFRTAAVFQRFGIDFCCGGRRTIAAACKTAHADPAALQSALEALPPGEASGDDSATRPLDQLAAHIVATHHTYIRTISPTIAGYLAKLVKVHGSRHPELAEIESTFKRLVDELEPHMTKEERILFPFISALERASAEAPLSCPFGTVANPIRMMEQEHEDAGTLMEHIRDLSKAFAPPEDGCTTYRVCFAELARFEADLHLHIHLENNVLFPRALVKEGVACV